MNKETIEYETLMNAWIETQKVSVESCDLVIRHAKEQIELLKRQINLESKEKRLKSKQLDSAVAAFKKYMAANK